MRFTRDEGFIIKRINFGEADRVLTIFSKENGKIKVVAKGIRKITSRRGALLEPFNLVKFHTVQSHSRHILTEVELISSFDVYKSNLDSYKKILIVCELIDALCAEDAHLKSVYEKVLKFAYYQDRDNSLSEFRMNILRDLGYWNNREFATEDDSYRYIESIIERKIKSRTINF